MGCQLGKLAASAAAPVEAAAPPPCDPRLPLTARQKYSMLASWKGIARAMENTGICMFINPLQGPSFFIFNLFLCMCLAIYLSLTIFPVTCVQFPQLKNGIFVISLP
ncbi:unnamed protein product [Plutella xylostella]|uniref:(diamondback moth) hypothetical protein n=1 Tax=Plutella xylostella TaxID=51655 RepID=A0A8S4DMY8_PLUXY|nr:unnamed protein product [Plutella xylostella]